MNIILQAFTGKVLQVILLRNTKQPTGIVLNRETSNKGNSSWLISKFLEKQEPKSLPAFLKQFTKCI